MNEEKINIAYIKFRQAGKTYAYVYKNLNLQVGDYVVVDTDRGPSLGIVASFKYVDKSEYTEKNLKYIIRKATKKDISPGIRLDLKQTTQFVKKKIAELKLDMRVIAVEIQFNSNKVIVYFTAKSRVDFRDLVKGLAGGLKARVELKQVGARDETKVLSGVGICGKEYCCSSFLSVFNPISIKMAKNQNLALNPSKFTGGCGKLLCCLSYEDNFYLKLKELLPTIGSKVRLKDGSLAIVTNLKILQQKCVVQKEDETIMEVDVSDFEVIELAKVKEDSEEIQRLSAEVDDNDVISSEVD